MATKKKTADALTSTEKKEAAALAELTDFFDNVSTDGMEDVSGEDIKLAVKVFNLGGVDAKGNARRKNVFLDNITEESSESIDCVLLLTQKTHLWQTFNNATKRNDTICQSQDRVTGTLRETSERRDCKDCPDKGWFLDEASGERKPRCGEVHNAVCIEAGTNRPFVVRFKKTALKPFRAYLMQHHFGARQKEDGTRAHIPLFAYNCKLSLSMHESGNFALPVFERGAMLSKEEMMRMHESAKGYLEMMGDVLAVADNADDSHASSEGGAGSTADDFADEGG